MSGDWFSRIANALPEPMLLLEVNGSVLGMNLAMEAMLEPGRPGLPPLHASELFSTPLDEVQEYLRLCSGVRDMLPGTLSLRRSVEAPVDMRCEGAGTGDGTVLVRVKPKLAAVERFLWLNEQIELLNREIRERKLMEQALREAQDELTAKADELERRVEERTAKLREMVGEMEAFSYSISHDMRAPLRAMSSYSSILIEEHAETLGLEGARLLQRIKQSAVRLDRLITDVLTYSRVVQTELNLGPVEVDALVHALAEQYPEWQPPKADVQIEGRLGSVLANEAMLGQCITNVISNAVKFVAPNTRPKVRIRAEAAGERDNQRVRILFEDNGIGIDPADQRRIFKLFERVHGPEYDGTGIGLSIVRKAVQRMNGDFGLRSEVGKGSTFWIEFKKAG